MTKTHKGLLDINRNALEEECQDQPKMVFEWVEQAAVAARRVKEAKNKLKLVEAQLILKIRADPQEYGIVGKVTESGINSAVILHPSYQQAQDAVIQAEYDSDVVDGMIKALNDRRSQLENLVKLYGQQYWSKPRIAEEDREAGRVEGSREAKIKPRTMRDPRGE